MTPVTGLLWQHDLPPGAWVRFEAHDSDFYVSAHVLAPPEPPAGDLPATVREAAWRTQVIPHNPDAALLKYARANDLGAPLSCEFYVTHDQITYCAQAYAAAIVYAPEGQWHEIDAIPW